MRKNRCGSPVSWFPQVNYGEALQPMVDSRLCETLLGSDSYAPAITHPRLHAPKVVFLFAMMLRERNRHRCLPGTSRYVCRMPIV